MENTTWPVSLYKCRCPRFALHADECNAAWTRWQDAVIRHAEALRRRVCGSRMSDGNRDDPTYAFCGHAKGHAGPHGDWEY